jgi:hypothetical protein
MCLTSSSLAAAWRVVVLRGECRLIQPLLVTGCKIWHLRPKSLFYPKLQFMNSMRKLKPGSQVQPIDASCTMRAGSGNVAHASLIANAHLSLAKHQVIMLFGEIDCREGLLLSVQKCKASL